MPNFCMVGNCGSIASRDINVRFFRLPSIYSKGRKVIQLAKERRERWILAIKRGDLTESILKYGRVCSKHFYSGQPADLNDRENPDWVPSVNMGYTPVQLQRNMSHCERVTSHRKVPITSTPIPTTSTSHEGECAKMETDTEKVKQLQLALLKANEEIYSVRDQLKKYKLDEDYFINNDKD